MTLLTKQEIEALRDGTTPGPWLREAQGIYADNGHKLIASVKSHEQGIAWPTTEANGNIMAAAPDLMDTAFDALTRLEDAEAAQALVVERLRVPLQFMVDSIAEDKAYVAEKYPILFALIQARRAEMGTLGGVQVFGEIARDLLGILAADPSGVAALVALRAERDALKVPYDELYADALADAKSDAQDFESDLWKSIRSILNDLDYDWSGDAMEDGVTADEAAQFIRDALEGETHRAEKAEAERDDALARLAAAEGRVAALTAALVDHNDLLRSAAATNEARAALATVTPPADTTEGRT